jgi:hypothetical protein
MNKLSFLIICYFLILSCNQEEKTSEKVETLIIGNIIENIGDSLQKLEGKEYDTINNKLISEGTFFKNLKKDKIYRTNWHTFYTAEGLIYARKEYFLLYNENEFEESLSQYIFFDNNGDTIKSKSSYFTIYSNHKDSIKLKDTIKLQMEIFHTENKHRKPDSYLLLMDNSQQKLKNELKFRNPIIKYEYIPADTGKINLRGQILIFIPDVGDSLELVHMTFEKKFVVKNY